MKNLSNTYKKHGFDVKEKNDSLLISFKDSSKTDIIVRFDNSSTPLSFEKVKVHYEHFLSLGQKVNSYQYRLICAAGFENECEFFSQVNIALSGPEYLNSLTNINHIELFAHNDIAYSKLNSQLKVANKACVIQPTGTGKSLILAKFISDRPNSNFVYLSPSKFIFKEVNKHLINSNNIKFITFHKLINLTVKEIQHLNPDFIIVDEFHRCGGEEWGSGVELLLKTYPDAKLLGTTATHIRYLDDKRNMADEMFDGNIAHHLTLSKALALGILPTPKYISALYKLDEEYLRVKKSIASSLAEDKKILLERLNKVKLEFENTHSIPNILQQHISGDIQKIIVFTKDIKHLRKHKPMVLNWFYSLGYSNMKVYEVHSENEQKNKDIFKTFEQQNEELGIMFSVNMLNEGIHVKGVNCIIMLRDTESPIIYYQQMGRCLTVGSEKAIIFDLVNNFANIRHRDLANEVINEFNELKELYKTKGTPYREIEFEIFDKVRNLKELIEEIEISSNSWNVFFRKLETFYSEHNHCNVPKNFEDQWLINKVYTTRRMYKSNQLSEDIINKLNRLNFSWSVNEDRWNEFIEKLIAFKNLFGHCDVPKSYKDKGLKEKVISVRYDFNRGKLPKEKVDDLNNLGFTWNLQTKKWETFISQLELFKQEYGHCNVTKSYKNEELLKSVHNVRKEYRKGVLPKEYINILESMGFSLNTYKDSYHVFLDKIIEFKKEYGHCNVPSRYKDKWLANKTISLRINYSKNKLYKIPSDIIEVLNEIGFCWDFFSDKWIKFLEKLELFKKIHGHCNVPYYYEKDRGLSNAINQLRHSYRLGNVSKELIDKLNELGFLWDTKLSEWNIFIQNLETFKNLNGHCNVTYSYEKKLATKVRSVRQSYKNNTLSEEKIIQLNEMGFQWTNPRTKVDNK